MDVKFFCLTFLASFFVANFVSAAGNSTALVRDFVPRRSNRTSKILIYNRGGSIRMVCGILVPTFIPKWQNINMLVNWSVGFNMPTNANEWLQKFSGNANWAVTKRSMDVIEKGDDTRQRFYNFIEKEFARFGSKGHECLLRTICEVAEAPITHNGLIGELMQLVFTPGDDEQVNIEYKLAKKAGYHGADCQELYHECPYGHGFLEKFSVLGYVTSKTFLKAFL
ncbi:uncharacterized protein LOC134831799 [Culicoides brevitarsis]|uniref:uncharacterized protein LOC134831799 n=1 Tax=Culicoides brevitarsis TaxID=469753 RepID=UPI00307C9F38